MIEAYAFLAMFTVQILAMSVVHPAWFIGYCRSQATIIPAERLAEAGVEGPFDAVFHCAAVMGHENPDPRDLWDSNVAGTANVADACIAHGVKKLVYTSTICVYGRGYAQPVSEDEPTCPIEDYGRSKLEGEKALASAKSQIELESNRARDALRGQVVSLAVAGAKRVLEKEIDQKTHGELLDQLAAKL